MMVPVSLISLRSLSVLARSNRLKRLSKIERSDQRNNKIVDPINQTGNGQDEDGGKNADDDLEFSIALLVRRRELVLRKIWWRTVHWDRLTTVSHTRKLVPDWIKIFVRSFFLIHLSRSSPRWEHVFHQRKR